MVKLSQLRREMAEKLDDTAWYIEGWSLERLAFLAEIDPAQIEDDEAPISEDQPLADGWSPDLDDWQARCAERDRTERAEIEGRRRNEQIDRGSLGGTYRIAAALARQQGGN